MNKVFPLSAFLLGTATAVSAVSMGAAPADPAAPPQAQAVLPQSQKDAILRYAEENRPAMSATAMDLWKYAEVGFHETKSSALLQKELRDAGFKVEPGVAGMPTAFIASAGSGGPVIAILAEYDALPGLAQTAAPEMSPIPGQLAGHACGHNLFGSASVSGAIVLKKWMDAYGVKGVIRVYGSPAEEGGFGKVYMVRDGLFKDVDITLNWHPADQNMALAGYTMAWITGKFHFKGVASHAAFAPERGRSALDAVEIMDVATNFLREHVPQDTRIQYVITNGGGQPNIVPADAESFYYVRNYDPVVTRDVWNRVNAAAQGAALATGTTVSVEVVGASYSVLPNDTLGRLMDRTLREVGGITYTPEETAYAAKIAATMPPVARPLDPAQIQPYNYGQKVPASSDVGDVSWVTPTGGFTTATWTTGVIAHTWQATALSGNSVALKGAEVAAKTLALSGAELLLNPTLIAEAKAEFVKKRGPNFQYEAMLGDRAPPLDYTDKK